MKIQKTLLYGLAIVGGIIVILYLTKGKGNATPMATGGATPPVPPVGATPPIAPVTPPVV